MDYRGPYIERPKPSCSLDLTYVVRLLKSITIHHINTQYTKYKNCMHILYVFACVCVYVYIYTHLQAWSYAWPSIPFTVPCKKSTPQLQSSWDFGVRCSGFCKLEDLDWGLVFRGLGFRAWGVWFGV